MPSAENIAQSKHLGVWINIWMGEIIGVEEVLAAL